MLGAGIMDDGRMKIVKMMIIISGSQLTDKTSCHVNLLSMIRVTETSGRNRDQMAASTRMTESIKISCGDWVDFG